MYASIAWCFLYGDVLWSKEFTWPVRINILNCTVFLSLTVQCSRRGSNDCFCRLEIWTSLKNLWKCFLFTKLQQREILLTSGQNVSYYALEKNMNFLWTYQLKILISCLKILAFHDIFVSRLIYWGWKKWQQQPMIYVTNWKL